MHSILAILAFGSVFGTQSAHAIAINDYAIYSADFHSQALLGWWDSSWNYAGGSNVSSILNMSVECISTGEIPLFDFQLGNLTRNSIGSAEIEMNLVFGFYQCSPLGFFLQSDWNTVKSSYLDFMGNNVSFEENDIDILETQYSVRTIEFNHSGQYTKMSYDANEPILLEVETKFMGYHLVATIVETNYNLTEIVEDDGFLGLNSLMIIIGICSFIMIRLKRDN